MRLFAAGNSPEHLLTETRFSFKSVPTTLTLALTLVSRTLAPYIIMAQMRFPDGLSLELFADAEKRKPQDEILAAIRTIRRIPSVGSR